MFGTTALCTGGKMFLFPWRDAAPPGHGHQQRLGRTTRLRSCPGGEAEVGGDPPDAAGPPEPAEIGGDQGPAQRGQQPLGRDSAGSSQRPPDVLVMDNSLHQPDSAAQGSMQPVRLQMSGQQRE